MVDQHENPGQQILGSERRHLSTGGMALLFSIIVQLAIVAWSYGRVSQAVEDIAARMMRVEQKLDTLAPQLGRAPIP